MPKIQVCIIAVLILFLNLGTFVPAVIIIDDFTTPQIVPMSSQGTAAGSGILGGERDVWTGSNFIADFNAAVPGHFYGENSSSTNAAGISIIYDGLDGNVEESDYSGLGSVDLTGGGKYDGFRLRFTQIDDDGSYMTCVVQQGQDKFGFFDSRMPTQPGDFLIPFAAFSTAVPASLTDSETDAGGEVSLIDFTDVGYIRLYLSIMEGGSYTIESFAAVPEPASLTLLVLGGLLLRRRVR